MGRRVKSRLGTSKQKEKVESYLRSSEGKSATSSLLKLRKDILTMTASSGSGINDRSSSGSNPRAMRSIDSVIYNKIFAIFERFPIAKETQERRKKSGRSKSHGRSKSE